MEMYRVDRKPSFSNQNHPKYYPANSGSGQNMADLFKEIIPSILQTKEYALLTEKDEKDYPSFMVNKALSFHRDTVLIANIMNQNHFIDNKMKYDFLLNTVKPMRRPFTKWPKKVIEADLEVVKGYYGYSDAKAYDVLGILTPEQLMEMRKIIDTGG